MADIPNRAELEAKLARALAKLQRSQMARLLEELGDPPRMENVSQAFWDETGKELARVLAPFLEKVYLEQAMELMGKNPVGVDWALISQRAVEFASNYSFELVRGINQTTQQALRRAVAAYFERGQTIGELEESISSLFGPIRAEGISVTEITRAASEGEIAIGEELAREGVLMIATWNTNADELVCPICRPLNKRKADGYEGTRRPYWIHPVSGKQYGPPPSAHPRDRCWVNWELPKVGR